MTTAEIAAHPPATPFATRTGIDNNHLETPVSSNNNKNKFLNQHTFQPPSENNTPARFSFISPSKYTYTFGSTALPRKPRAWQRAASQPFAPRNDARTKIWKRQPLGDVTRSSQGNTRSRRAEDGEDDEEGRPLKRLRVQRRSDFGGKENDHDDDALAIGGEAGRDVESEYVPMRWGGDGANEEDDRRRRRSSCGIAQRSEESDRLRDEAAEVMESEVPDAVEGRIGPDQGSDTLVEPAQWIGTSDVDVQDAPDGKDESQTPVARTKLDGFDVDGGLDLDGAVHVDYESKVPQTTVDHEFDVEDLASEESEESSMIEPAPVASDIRADVETDQADLHGDNFGSETVPLLGVRDASTGNEVVAPTLGTPAKTDQLTEAIDLVGASQAVESPKVSNSSSPIITQSVAETVSPSFESVADNIFALPDKEQNNPDVEQTDGKVSLPSPLASQNPATITHQDDEDTAYLQQFLQRAKEAREKNQFASLQRPVGDRIKAYLNEQHENSHSTVSRSGTKRSLPPDSDSISEVSDYSETDAPRPQSEAKPPMCFSNKNPIRSIEQDENPTTTSSIANVNFTSISNNHNNGSSSPSSRRSSARLTKLPRPQRPVIAPLPSNIALRRLNGTEFVSMAKIKTEAQNAALLMRTNTRKNKDGALPVPQRLLQMYPVDENGEQISQVPADAIGDEIEGNVEGVGCSGLKEALQSKKSKKRKAAAAAAAAANKKYVTWAPVIARFRDDDGQEYDVQSDGEGEENKRSAKEYMAVHEAAQESGAHAGMGEEEEEGGGGASSPPASPSRNTRGASRARRERSASPVPMPGENAESVVAIEERGVSRGSGKRTRDAAATMTTTEMDTTAAAQQAAAATAAAPAPATNTSSTPQHKRQRKAASGTVNGTPAPSGIPTRSTGSGGSSREAIAAATAAVGGANAKRVRLTRSGGGSGRG